MPSSTSSSSRLLCSPPAAAPTDDERRRQRRRRSRRRKKTLAAAGSRHSCRANGRTLLLGCRDVFLLLLLVLPTFRSSPRTPGIILVQLAPILIVAQGSDAGATEEVATAAEITADAKVILGRAAGGGGGATSSLSSGDDNVDDATAADHTAAATAPATTDNNDRWQTTATTSNIRYGDHSHRQQHREQAQPNLPPNLLFIVCDQVCIKWSCDMDYAYCILYSLFKYV